MCLVSKEQIEELYIKQGLTKAETAKRLGISNKILFNYCNKYGIKSTKFWTDDEINYLENNYGVHSLNKMSKKLNRTEKAIKEKCYKLGLTSALNSTGMLNPNEIANALGTHRSTIYKFIKNKGLPAKKQVVLRNGEFWRIDPKDFWDWLEQNKYLVDLSKFEKNSLGPEPEWVDIKRRNDIKGKNRHNKNWSKAEINYLKANYKIKSHKEIAIYLNRSLQSVQAKSKKLNLSKLIQIKWRDIEIDTLIKMKKAGCTDYKIAEELGRSILSVDGKRKQLLKAGILAPEYSRARG